MFFGWGFDVYSVHPPSAADFTGDEWSEDKRERARAGGYAMGKTQRRCLSVFLGFLIVSVVAHPVALQRLLGKRTGGFGPVCQGTT